MSGRKFGDEFDAFLESDNSEDEFDKAAERATQEFLRDCTHNGVLSPKLIYEKCILGGQTAAQAGFNVKMLTGSTEYVQEIPKPSAPASDGLRKKALLSLLKSKK